jgi:hypothetical protein
VNENRKTSRKIQRKRQTGKIGLDQSTEDPDGLTLTECGRTSDEQKKEQGEEEDKPNDDEWRPTAKGGNRARTPRVQKNSVGSRRNRYPTRSWLIDCCLRIHRQVAD